MKVEEKMVVTATQLKKHFADTTGRAQHGGERIVVRRNSKEAFALIPIDDLRLLEALEDKIDVLAAEAVLASDEPVVSWEDAKEELA